MIELAQGKCEILLVLNRRLEALGHVELRVWVEGLVDDDDHDAHDYQEDQREKALVRLELLCDVGDLRFGRVKVEVHVLDVAVHSLHLLRLPAKLVRCERASFPRTTHHPFAPRQRLDRLLLHLRCVLYQLRGRERVRGQLAPPQHVLPPLVVLQCGEQRVEALQRSSVLRKRALPLRLRIGRLGHLEPEGLEELLCVVEVRGDVPQLLHPAVALQAVHRVEREADLLLDCGQVRLVRGDVLLHL
eukprot:CAMPEP_0180024934 /NCGR_PEP_ID=MMETSP0984-20121128/24358_1 /TAXON_ID=483367 /ORGANISM="non described non described, Strain CCMP 2436" /LENGTH=244 /DNA_ID=CAMNT_0021949475 /DNA_START=108 /DNA_END=838 /DNA_ORIENTATION=-